MRAPIKRRFFLQVANFGGEEFEQESGIELRNHLLKFLTEMQLNCSDDEVFFYFKEVDIAHLLLAESSATRQLRMPARVAPAQNLNSAQTGDRHRSLDFA